MMWVDYTINNLPGKGFKVEGDTPTEVMDKGLYKPLSITSVGVSPSTLKPLPGAWLIV